MRQLVFPSRSFACLSGPICFRLRLLEFITPCHESFDTMIYLLVQHLRVWLDAHHLGFLRVFTAVEFQATAAIVLSFVICLALGPRVIAWLRKQKIGDLPDFDQAEINKLMEGKKGTPTMGGVLIISSIFVTTILLADLSNFYV